ncbi:short-chain dehydrogenase/reductase SDR [Reticulomyxa filosa]|uniref:Short-chain dehydrogenase/reductase SDR n=1 Tax=Reticulomyxa filosa TaxID=46433 RepID=X6ME28_RETFI|nr:short-chain dehydrogenase/reductase SDR [Reticulomyxa filosa]|eukprot:ETO12268.1 short-chain dehydrogenase/reductase SDR [Reticulomyxa filosa]
MPNVIEFLISQSANSAFAEEITLNICKSIWSNLPYEYFAVSKSNFKVFLKSLAQVRQIAPNTLLPGIMEQKEEEKKKGKFIVISGVTSGIGRALAVEFSNSGHVVAGFGRRQEEIQKLKTELKIQNDLLFVSLDIRDSKAVHAWAAKAIEAFGVPNLVIHSAGIQGKLEPMDKLDIEMMKEVFDINTFGFVHLVQAFLPAMKNADGHEGLFIPVTSCLVPYVYCLRNVTKYTFFFFFFFNTCIRKNVDENIWTVCNVKKVHGKKANAELSAYCGSKFALEAFIQALAEELADEFGSRLGVIGMAPGFVSTELTSGAFAIQLCNTDENNPVIPTPQSWAKSAAPWILGLTSSHNGKSLAPPVEKTIMQGYFEKLSQWVPDLDINNLVHSSE